jgi:glucose/arabinose dehydrogenase
VRRLPTWLVVGVLGLPLAMGAERPARTTATTVSARPVGTGLTSPESFTVAPDGRIFYAERTMGMVAALNPADGSHLPFAQVPDLCASGDEGLHGLASTPGSRPLERCTPSPPDVPLAAHARTRW